MKPFLLSCIAIISSMQQGLMVSSFNQYLSVSQSTHSTLAFIPHQQQQHQRRHYQQREQLQTFTLKYAKQIDTILPDSLTPEQEVKEEVKQTQKQTQTQKRKQKPVKKQKKTKKKNAPSKQEILWNTRYEELVEFYKINTHSNVPYNHPNHKLSRWVTNQRQNKKLKKRSMTTKRINALNKVDFVWETRSTWETRFDELKQYSLMYGDCNVSLSTNRDLSRFVSSQRSQYKLYMDNQENCNDSKNSKSDISTNNSSSMTEDRIKSLISIGFEFDNNKNSKDSAWMARYNQLKQFQQQHNHCLVPTTDRNLGRWVETQRTAYRLKQKTIIENEKSSSPNAIKTKTSSLTQERIDLLNAINFIWDPIDARFNERVKELKDYQLEHGHCDVPFSTDQSLHLFVKKQRDQYQKYVNGDKSSLTDDRIELLKNAGLLLKKEQQPEQLQQQRRTKTPWIVKFNQLQGFAEKYGHCIVPQKHPHLGKFVKAQRNSYRLMKMGKKSSITIERIDKLNSIGFVWNVANRKRPLREIAIQQAIRNTMSRKAQPQQKTPHMNTEMLLEHYERRSLWG
jgi:hypothetical protein